MSSGGGAERRMSSERELRARIAELERLNADLSAALEEKAQAQQETLLREAHFRADFESAGVGKVHSDPTTGVIIRANRAYAAMLGYEPEDLVGRNGWEFTHPDDRPEAEARYGRLFQGEIQAYAREKRYLRRDGSWFWGRVSAAVVRTPEGETPFLAIAVVEDVDERHRALAAVEAAKQELERVVEERTAALAQRDLLLREVYHRVKNNLQLVDSLILLQARRLGDPGARAALQTLRGRVYAIGLVHHQLMGSNDLETFDIAPFLRDLSRHLIDSAGDNAARLSIDAPPRRVGLDFAVPLGLLVTELVTNSMKYAFPEGGGAIAVELKDGDEGEVVLVVADDGVGYDPAALDADRPTLGASIVAGLVRQLNGVLDISTENGVRTVVRLPAPRLP
ncbi:MAG: PAS domain S-box protein [Phenylobacterium sp.]|uniref:sensor histidine kinase n=1 Tax=Phenylobacterium sp. TaxID=1871053 RepID=UPI0025F9D58B|nr:PAS domain S-box protein [Phenylobacterium sp.]MBI1198721.1 PAS domain S-box protein [Phenylobacterium sp.]